MELNSGVFIRDKRERNIEIMEVNIVTFITIALFVLVIAPFFLIIYVKTVSQSDFFL
ncbi:photosystem II reaction center M protein PsbM [Medicago truncatula]|uniref:Photosystem II reaction center M protein PsbM n=1 Tax=Medicago truncatula TaxID=3880 RepID=G7IW78_MEDTR|nr:photosystem II reaction center M protein PsbM [Medicago truncatula]